jgi:hypothetical protein
MKKLKKKTEGIQVFERLTQKSKPHKYDAFCFAVVVV